MKAIPIPENQSNQNPSVSSALSELVHAPGKTSSASAVVAKQYKDSEGNITLDTTKEETISVQTFVTEPAKVQVELGLTLNVGNYQSARITIGLVLPCYKEEADAAFQYAKDWVGERAQQEADEVRKFFEAGSAKSLF